MKRPPIELVFVLLAVAALSCAGPGANGIEKIFLPGGDREAGRETFQRLQCTACHAVTGVEGLSSPTVPEPAPDLGTSLRGVDKGPIVSAIVAPYHVDSRRAELWAQWSPSQRVWLGPHAPPPPEGTETAGGAEPSSAARPPVRMNDYRGTMTVQQLCDLVEFLYQPRG